MSTCWTSVLTASAFKTMYREGKSITYALNTVSMATVTSRNLPMKMFCNPILIFCFTKMV